MIAVDAMGGDYAPRAVVLGAYKAAKSGIPLLLYGDAKQLEATLFQLDTHWDSLPIQIIDCQEIIGMGDEPGRAVLHKKKSSLVCAVKAVAEGKAQAVVTAGNSGAALVAGTLLLGRVEGVMRPAIGDFLPTKSGSVFCMDLGANVDCKPDYLVQFARMASVYVSLVNNIVDPRIALLSNGAEPYKGSAAVKQAFGMLECSGLNFVGNIEPRDMFDDRADVVVCDGFIGNMVLKAMQGTARAMVSWIDQERKQSWLYSLGLLLSKGLFKGLKRKIDYAQKGGALLLGVNHPLLIAHGCSNEIAIENAIKRAHYMVQERLVERYNERLIQELARAPHSKHSSTIVGTFKDV